MIGRIESKSEDLEDSIGGDGAIKKRYLSVRKTVFEPWMKITPRYSAADALIGMGVKPGRVNKMLGTGSIEQQRKIQELVLRDMGVSDDVADRMLTVT